MLESLHITTAEVRAQVARIVGRGEEVTAGQIPFTPRAKKVLELSLREALSLGHNYISTEHVLLGLVRENEGVAARILLDFDADPERVRQELFRMLSGPGRRLEPEASAEPNPDVQWTDYGPARPTATRDVDARAPHRRDRGRVDLRHRAPHRLADLGMTDLSTGAEMRVTGVPAERAVVCVNGGHGGGVAGTWSATLEWLVRRLAPSFPDLAFGEVSTGSSRGSGSTCAPRTRSPPSSGWALRTRS